MLYTASFFGNSSFCERSNASFSNTTPFEVSRFLPSFTGYFISSSHFHLQLLLNSLCLAPYNTDRLPRLYLLILHLKCACDLEALPYWPASINLSFDTREATGQSMPMHRVVCGTYLLGHIFWQRLRNMEPL